MLLIKNGRILTMAEGELNPGCILIKSGKIANSGLIINQNRIY